MWVDNECTKWADQTFCGRDNTFGDIFCDILSPAIEGCPRYNSAVAVPISQKGDLKIITRNLAHEIQTGAVCFLPLVMQGHLHGGYKKPPPDSIVVDALDTGLVRDVYRETQIEPLHGPEVGLFLDRLGLASLASLASLTRHAAHLVCEEGIV